MKKGKGGPKDNPLKPMNKRASADENYRAENPYLGKKGKKASKKTGK